MIDDQRLSASLAVDVDAHFEEMVRTFQDRLYGFALRLTRSPADAEEAIQDTFVRAYRALQRYPSDRVATLRVRAWLYQIALNVVRNRARRPTLAAVALDDSMSPPAAQQEQPERIFALKETRAHLAKALRSLPERYATAVILRHVQGLSYAEAADVLGQPVGTTKSDVHRGLRILREALEVEGVEDYVHE
jgi:RNA polymerase sigma-70 factor (ECF subfamily)